MGADKKTYAIAGGLVVATIVAVAITVPLVLTKNKDEPQQQQMPGELINVTTSDNNNNNNDNNSEFPYPEDGQPDGNRAAAFLNQACPSTAGSTELFELQFGIDGVELYKSAADQLCTLVAVGMSGTEQFLTPIARSYNGQDWNIAAGKYASQFTIPIDCTTIPTYCQLDFTGIADFFGGSGTQFQLTTFDAPTYSNQDIVARFLEQATFGPTWEGITQLDTAATNEGTSLDYQFAKWVQTQQDASQVPITSHREVFRTRMNARTEVPSPNGPPTQPCDAGTRYRRTAFSIKDKKKTLEIKSLPSDSNRKVLLVDGQYRTTVSGPFYTGKQNKGKWSIAVEQLDWPDGTYTINKVDSNDFDPNDYVFVQHPTNGKKSVPFLVASTETAGAYDSNPLVYYDAAELTGAFDPPVVPDTFAVLTVPASSAETIDTQFFTPRAVTEGDTLASPADREILVTNAVNDALCTAEASSAPVLATWNGHQYIHDPRFLILQNDVANPIADGGGSLVNEFAVPDEAFTVQCSNVPRTFLNEEGCTLSTDPNVCTYRRFEQKSRQTSAEVNPNFIVSRENIRKLYEVTKDQSRTAYYYAVEGLDINKDDTVPPPCTPGDSKATKSRWLIIDCAGYTSTVSATTNDYMVTRILKEAAKEGADLLPFVDAYHPKGATTRCDEADIDAKGFEVYDAASGACWRNVHTDYLNVYNFETWAKVDENKAHPGNTADFNPIIQFAIDGLTTLTFPDSHDPATRWQTNKKNLGRTLKLGQEFDYYKLPLYLQTDAVATALGLTLSADAAAADAGAAVDSGNGATMVCGSPYEAPNQPALGGSLYRGAYAPTQQEYMTSPWSHFRNLREMIWLNTALNDEGQLRQRVAWALSQILSVHPPDVPDGKSLVEPFLNYYDIFVRHAFGTYGDVLKEVSYSPIMSDMLTYYGGRSTAEVYEDENTLEFADENYAREIMQLFTTGLFQLNMDGTEIYDATGDQEKVYSNDDIEEYARAWTGFVSQHKRGNAEVQRKNTIDPMKIVPEWRDRLPKYGLDNTYIGDGYPLCSDLPADHFLAKGATYRLLGGQPSPELVTDPPEWNTESATVLVSLDATGGLYQKLCAPDGGGTCNYANTVVLDTSVACTGIECQVDTLRSVKVGDMYYEYIRFPCVELGFFNNAKTIAERTGNKVNAMCANPSVEAATVACCETGTAVWDEQYFGERALFASAETRCNQLLCTTDSRPSCDVADSSVGTRCYDNNYFWTSQACALKAKIDRSTGKVAIVHQPDGVAESDVASIVQPVTETYFRVDWDGDFATVLADCGNLASCSLTDDGTCLCDVTVADSQVFSQNPTKEQVLSSLSIGSFEPAVGVTTTTPDGVNVYGALSADTIFEVMDDFGVQQRRKNVESRVTVGTTGLSFRNPVHFMSLSDPEIRDAQFETDAAIEHYLYHRNTPPFLAIRFAQRFGISNPSPAYVNEIATAFTTGSYTFEDNGQQIAFGSGSYGDLGATFAAVLLSPEARSVVLDKDPAHGSLKEPIIKVISLMRALKFTLNSPHPWVEMAGVRVGESLGQFPHQLPSVFSFFLPEYQPAGPVALGSLVAPEAQVLTGPRIIDTMNGIYSLLKYGLVACNQGFAPNFAAVCKDAKIGTQLGIGYLAYEPSTSDVVGELSTLLTAGRLNAATKTYISDFYAQESKFPLIKAQMMISTTPEFHATGSLQQTAETRPTRAAQSATSNPYKAFVFVLLAGGNDSYNMLVPHTCADTNAAGKTLLEQYMSERSSVALTEAERSRVIDATGQPCSQFAVHPDFPFGERLYKEGKLNFFANMGQLDAPVTKDNYKSVTKSDLFAHNTMQKEAQRVDPWQAQQNTGILGRMSDKLAAKGYNAQPITIKDSTIATVGVPGAAVEPLVAPFGGPKEFDPAQKRDTIDMSDFVAELNKVTELHSSVYGETWSRNLHQAIQDSDVMTGAYDNIKLTREYKADEEGPNYMRTMEAVSSLIMTRTDRGADRDVIFVQLGGWDHHRGLKETHSSYMSSLDSAFQEFENEMKEAGIWDQVTVAVTSDFGRTLTPNSGEGSDHAWAGNYMMFGGSVKGGQILGEYPGDITTDGDLNVGRGRLIPTSSWETMLNSAVQWMGLDTEDELNYCMPNRIQTGTRLYTKDEVFNADSGRALRGAQ